MRPRTLGALALLVTLVPMLPVAAQRIAIGAKASTLGPGAEIALGLTRKLNLRVGANLFNYTYEHQVDLDVAVNTTTDAKFRSFTGIVDYMPFGNFLRLSGGMVLNNNEATILIAPIDGYTIQDKTFTPEEIGSVTTTLGWKSKTAPYVGLGFGNAVSPGKHLGFTMDIGGIYAGSPRVAMVGTKLIGPTATQAASIEESAKNLKWFPMIAFGLSYKIK